ncbi:MAG TPA: hypothetical protein VG755_16000 [Nannocystaceae bacterium]|nr:hypothetical protein [Nannocystaceae bacterium]
MPGPCHLLSLTPLRRAALPTTAMSTTSRSRRVLRVLGLALLVMTLNVAASVIYMVLYSYVIAPGRDAAHYDAHVQAAAPWSSVIVGAPLMFFASRWLARRTGTRDGIGIAIAYIVIDSAILLGAGALARLAPIVALSFATKLAAAWAGAATGWAPAWRAPRGSCGPGSAQ